MAKYSIGIDYGTLSARALLLDLHSGKEVAVSEFVYPHSILKSEFFDNVTLESGMSLQHPQDYLDGLRFTFHDLLERTGVDPADICGVGIDFTSSTTLPVTADGTPLCFLEKFRNEPHAYVKLWNHHSAQAEAEELTAVAAVRKEAWLEMYSGKACSDWLFPKLYETLHKAPGVYQETARYIEAGDWLVWQLTGKEKRSSSMAGFKGMWTPELGYPSNDFFAAVHPLLGDVIGTKVPADVYQAGTFGGTLSEHGQVLTGLPVGTAVSLPLIDAHAPVCAAGITHSGQLMMSLGTSGCHIIMGDKLAQIPGVFGCITGGILPGYVGLDASQASMGDTFAWFTKNCVPESYAIEARERGIDIFRLLTEKAEILPAGSNGILAIDWWNGNRCPYSDFDLSGMILGLTLKTKPEEIYRGIIESCAYATRTITDLYQEGGITIHDAFAGGGIARKNPMLMQIYADVLQMDIKVVNSTQAGAKGSAIFAAVAGGAFETLDAAAAVLADKTDITYHPRKECAAAYDRLYSEYKTLCAYFATENHIMKRLRGFRNQ